MKSDGKKKICEALCRLADGINVDDVTVSNIIAEAGINRTTFYYHFESTRAVLNYMMETFCKSYLDKLLLPHGAVAQEVNGEVHNSMMHECCRFIRENQNREYVQLFFQQQNYYDFHIIFRKNFNVYLKEHSLIKLYPDGHTELLRRGVLYDYQVQILCMNFFGFLELWAEHDFAEDEIEFSRAPEELGGAIITIQGK